MPRACKDTKAVATAFVAAKSSLDGHCKAIAGMQLLKVERKRTYELVEFARIQEKHQAEVLVYSALVHENHLDSRGRDE